jgi:four helix bundle protein
MTNTTFKSPERIRTEQLQERTFLFAKGVLDLCPRRYDSDPSRVIWRQLIRAAPSASSNLDEADEASSDDDFVYRVKVVLRETKESKRWLRFIKKCQLQQHQRLGKLPDEARQLCAIFATIVRNVERRLERERTEKQRTKPTKSSN